jgi:hypothetical protein
VAESDKSRSRLQKKGSPMASQNLNERYDVATLVALEQALKDVWEVLEAHNPYQDWNIDPELKADLTQKLMALADAGVKDHHGLRDRTLNTLSIGRH